MVASLVACLVDLMVVHSAPSTAERRAVRWVVMMAGLKVEWLVDLTVVLKVD